LAAELFLDVDLSAPRKGAQLRLALRQAIADGVLVPGARLPSSRALAADLGVARGVVVGVYEQLTAEGWLSSAPGSGTSVAANRAALHPPQRPAPTTPVAALDLRPARPDVAEFPRSAWVAATRAVLADLPHAELGYGDHRGPSRAREVVSAYLARVRGLRTTPDLVLLTEGFSAALSTVVTYLVAIGIRRIAVEDPGGYEPRGVVAAAGAELLPVPVDDEGLRVDELERSGAGAVMVTPAHQYPMGHVLGAERRVALAAWARRTGGWVIEDDYDAEFRYDREPVGAVQALLPDRTVHLGSVGKTLAPAVRVGWVAAPEELLGGIVETRKLRASQQATLDHLVVAQLIDEGRYDRHLRILRRRYRARRDVVLETLTGAGLDRHVAGVAAGLHVVIVLDGHDDLAVEAEIRDRGVEVVALSRYAMVSEARGLVVGYGQRPPADLRRGVGIIAEAVTGSTAAG
jgi:GntR family transcriptional regulator / MocR family aminotransferase